MSPDTRFCPNGSINLAIHQSLRYLNKKDAAAFRKKFRRVRDDDQQFMHTYRELLAGVFVARQGYAPLYEPVLEGLTPDWHFLADEGRPAFIADVVNFHIDSPIEAEQNRAMREASSWCGWLPDNAHRMYPSIQGKAGKYKDLASRRKLPFVVFVYSLFSACVQLHEVEACLHGKEGLFDAYPTLTGVCHFEGAVDGYNFVYLVNPKASHSGFSLEGGFLPVPLEPANT